MKALEALTCLEEAFGTSCVEEHLKGFYTKNVPDIGAELRIVCFGDPGSGTYIPYMHHLLSATFILNLGRKFVKVGVHCA